MQYDDLAFAVYSSGTTGKPKGILCPHRGAVFSYNLRHVDYPYSDEVEEREACNVFFVWEMLRPLLKGTQDKIELTQKQKKCYKVWFFSTAYFSAD